MVYTNADHQAALQAARNGQATAEQERKLQEAARQAGARGREAARALQGKK
jgi:thymidine phosphorylase